MVSSRRITCARICMGLPFRATHRFGRITATTVAARRCRPGQKYENRKPRTRRRGVRDRSRQLPVSWVQAWGFAAWEFQCSKLLSLDCQRNLMSPPTKHLRPDCIGLVKPDESHEEFRARCGKRDHDFCLAEALPSALEHNSDDARAPILPMRPTRTTRSLPCSDELLRNPGCGKPFPPAPSLERAQTALPRAPCTPTGR